MSRNIMKRIICVAVFALGLFSSAPCLAWYGGYHGGYYHGGGWHGGYYGGYHGGYYGYHGGYYHGGGWGWGGTGVVIGVPGYYYAPPACQTIRVCNAYGHCWYQDSCY
ncbi:hypothetical protein [Legionella sainthelensi]|nr:hypothetical protein [Legionella sainthelensi]